MKDFRFGLQEAMLLFLILIFMITVIKIVHTITWMIMASASFYILYAGIFGVFDVYLVISMLLLFVETVVLVLNSWTCPLTPMAQKYTIDRRDNFDIYLPLWLAKYNKVIFGAIFVAGIILVAWRWLVNI